MFITEVTRTTYNGADVTNSTINSYVETTMNSTVVLGSSSNSTISYNVWLYNNSDKDHVFIDVIKDEMAYKNTNITYSTDLVPYETVIGAGQNMDFNITFSYAGSDVSNNTLNSVLNFRFMEVPKLELSNAQAVTNIYPGATKEATFTVTNFDSKGTNGVPLDYTLQAEIYDETGTKVTEPITATICNESGTAVTKAVSMAGDSATKTTHTYKLKLAWDASYNSPDYAGKTYSYKIKAVAVPNATATESKYADYTLTKETTANITTAPFYFVTDPTSAETTSVEMADNKATINLTVSNNDGKNYNAFETIYTIALDNTDFTLYVNEVEYANNVTGNIQLGAGALINSVETIELKPKATSTTLTSEEICNLTITTTSPYTKTETIKIKATDKTAPTKPEITGGSETYAASQTISVSKESTDVGTGVKYYQYIVDSDGQSLATTATGNVGSTASEKSKTFNSDYNGYYVYFRAVDAVGNVGEWSNSQKLNIDAQPPIVEPTDETKAFYGESNDVTKYFTYEQNGKAEITEVKYTINGEEISNTESLALGTYTIECKVTKSTGLSATASKTIEVKERAVYASLYGVDDGIHLVFNSTGNLASGYTEDQWGWTSGNIVAGATTETWSSAFEGYDINPYITKVVIEEEINPLSCDFYFYCLTALTEIENIENINTSDATSMMGMFAACTSLKMLDLSSFNTDKVTNMVGMFMACQALMFLDISSFNTSNVEVCEQMFAMCNLLIKIYVGEQWTSESVSTSEAMFVDCYSIVGAVLYDASNSNDVAYANYTTGYLTYRGAKGTIENQNSVYGSVYAVNDTEYHLVFNKTGNLASGYTQSQLIYTSENLGAGANFDTWIKYATLIKKAVIAEEIKPKSCEFYFCWLEVLEEIENVEKLNTSNVEDMSFMFTSCRIT